MRDYVLLKTLTEMGDDTWIGPAELACLLGYAERTITQRRAEIPQPDKRAKRHLRWRLGDVREWMKSRTIRTASDNRDTPEQPSRKRKPSSKTTHVEETPQGTPKATNE